jgi:membrane-associated protease RseP (regulator of RpoE activity)
MFGAFIVAAVVCQQPALPTQSEAEKTLKVRDTDFAFTGMVLVDQADERLKPIQHQPIYYGGASGGTFGGVRAGQILGGGRGGPSFINTAWPKKFPAKGAIVYAVDKDSPLIALGIFKGDVITSIDNKPTPTVADVQAALKDAKGSIRIGFQQFNEKVKLYSAKVVTAAVP